MGDSMDLSNVDIRSEQKGLFLVAWHDRQESKGQNVLSWVAEIDRWKKLRWKFSVPSLCMGARIIGPNRIWVAEYASLPPINQELHGKITIRDFQGNITGQFDVPQPISFAHGLANGNIFVSMVGSLIEYEQTGKIAWSFCSEDSGLLLGRKLSDGRVVFVTAAGDVIRIANEFDKGTKLFNIGALGGAAIPAMTIEELPGGEFLTSLRQHHRVAEFDSMGNQLWTLEVERPFAASRLRNGHTLVTRVFNWVIEYDRFRQPVWSHQFDGPVYFAQKR
jgi:hypothetical protein